jgi:HTH-type transcriptional regulator/antitoxin HigA
MSTTKDNGKMSNINAIIPAWQSFQAATHIEPIRDQAHYQYMVETLESLLEETGDDESHPLMGLVDIVGDLIADYEAQHDTMPEATGVDALKFLMEQHGIKQADLSEIGSQGVVSEILNGKRALNVRQIKLLAERFSVSSATFL